MTATFSPVSLSYAAALRKIMPRVPGTDFTYLLAECHEPGLLIALAASNPEGHFYGLVEGAEAVREAGEDVRKRQVENISFIDAAPRSLLAKLDKDAGMLPELDYICCDESGKALDASERDALATLAERKLKAGGLFTLTYRPYSDDSGHLRFLVRELAPEMNAAQASEFLIELKKLGGFFFKDHPELLAKLNAAIAKYMPDSFFALFHGVPAQSKTFDTMVAMAPRGFTYAGDSHIPANYIELATPAESHAIVDSAKDSPLYEVVKDFAGNRGVRNDIWCRQPAAMNDDPTRLFGGFAYGITMAPQDVPSQFTAQGKTIPLDAPLYAKLIKLMTLTPAGIGDFLSQSGNGAFAPGEIIMALQVLIACGIVRPMRGAREADSLGSLAQPRLAGSFNQYLDKTSVTYASMTLASSVLGDVMTVSARDALVMQALDRAGLANAVSALLPELRRLAHNPSAAARMMDAGEPTPEIARQMIEDSVSHSIIQWYAYGLLEAA